MMGLLDRRPKDRESRTVPRLFFVESAVAVPSGVAGAVSRRSGNVAASAAVVFQVLGADAASWRMSGVKPVVESSWKPTAAAVPSLRAVTPESLFSRLPGFGLWTVFQLVPSQCSVRVAAS